MKAKIVPDVSSRESRQAKAMWLIIERDDEETIRHSLPLLFDELEAVRDAIEEYLEKVSQEEMK